MEIPEGWDLTGKKAVITADRRGWTKYYAGALAEAGADVAVAGSENSDMIEASKYVKNQGRMGFTLETDLMKRDSVNSMFEQAAEKLGGLDILVNNAKVDFGKRFEAITEDEWDILMNFNVKSMFLCCQAAGNKMMAAGHGRIINMTSDLAVRGLWNSVASCAAEGAIHQLTQSLALDWGRNGIRINGIGAGWLTTKNQSEESQKELLVRYLPSRRRGHPSELSALLVYLSSDECDFVNGQTIFIDGGALAHA